MGITIRDVADYADTSISTVSRYINGYSVKQENAKRIQKAINQFGYKVNRVARGLKMSKTMTVGILLSDMVGSGKYGISIIEEIEKSLDKHGYSMLLSSSRGEIDKEQKKTDLLLSMNVDGIILMPVGEGKEHVLEVISKKIPIILIDRIIPGVECDAVLADNINAVYEIVEYLVDRGHRKIAFVSGPKDVYTTQERLKGYKRAMQDYNIMIKDNYVIHGDYSQASGNKAIKLLIGLPEPPSAVIVANSYVTAGVVIGLDELGLKIPQDLSIIGFDYEELSQFTRPQLSIVVQPTNVIAEKVVDLLVYRINSKHLVPPQIHRVKTEFNEGKSVRSLT